MLLSFVGARRRRRALWPSGTQPASPEICLRLSCWSCASCISYHMLIKEPQTGRQRQTQHCKTEHLTHVCETNALQRQLCLLWFVPIAKNPHSIHCIPPLPIYLGKRRVVAGLCIGDIWWFWWQGGFPKCGSPQIIQVWPGDVRLGRGWPLGDATPRCHGVRQARLFWWPGSHQVTWLKSSKIIQNHWILGYIGYGIMDKIGW